MKFQSSFLNYFPNYKNPISEQIEPCSYSRAITILDKPLTDDEMNYFNEKIISLTSLFKKFKSIFSSDAQYFLFHKIKNLSEITDNYDYYLPEIGIEFKKNFNLNISNEQIFFLIGYLYLDQTLNEETYDNSFVKLDIQAKDGMIFFEHGSYSKIMPRIRERYSFLLSLFFDHDKNIFNGFNSNDNLEPREYISFLDCHSFSMNATNDKYCYLLSNKKGISFNSLSWTDIKNHINQPLVANSLEELNAYLFKVKEKHQTEKDLFDETIYSLIKKHSLNELKKLKINNIPLDLIIYNVNLRYDFNTKKFNEFLSNITHSKYLLEEISKIDKPNESIRKPKKI